VKQRRSLTHVGGAVQTAGDARIAAKLAEAIDVAPAPEPRRDGSADDDPDRAHVHGFHTYPARMHPTTAGRLVRAATERDALVLDPFCGSGTVLVETMIAGRRAAGTDLNPLAERLARLKTATRSPPALAPSRRSPTRDARGARAPRDATHPKTSRSSTRTSCSSSTRSAPGSPASISRRPCGAHSRSSSARSSSS
jgi:DNA methylase